MGFWRKLFGWECKYLGTRYCPSGSGDNLICSSNAAREAYDAGVESKDAGCYRTAREVREKEKTDLTKLCID